VEIRASWITRMLVVLTVEINAISYITIWDWRMPWRTVTGLADGQWIGPGMWTPDS